MHAGVYFEPESPDWRRTQGVSGGLAGPSRQCRCRWPQKGSLVCARGSGPQTSRHGQDLSRSPKVQGTPCNSKSKSSGLTIEQWRLTNGFRGPQML